MQKWDIEKMVAQGYKSGSIVRVKMLNFLTYDECEVFPGPKLNVVIGPNGTGKSTLTHAICLACGGSTGDVGRSNDLSKFVKHGKEGQESYAEVDIFYKQSVLNIRRTINSDTKGFFTKS
jgi:chromosome segregation ATPase